MMGPVIWVCVCREVLREVLTLAGSAMPSQAKDELKEVGAVVEARGGGLTVNGNRADEQKPCRVEELQ